MAENRVDPPRPGAEDRPDLAADEAGQQGHDLPRRQEGDESPWARKPRRRGRDSRYIRVPRGLQKRAR